MSQYCFSEVCRDAKVLIALSIREQPSVPSFRATHADAFQVFLDPSDEEFPELPVGNVIPLAGDHEEVDQHEALR
jgi:hypothetical protein